ncbi:MAG: basic amino acid ABC transporter substrate-binding protein [Fusobacteriaceae bacterium]|nr:basic amino acid ABC transporter substrate-binding protein [Fusobacteriaceae bacterium]MBP9510838.1 basic amino acid ABC transporter substrate-binding protein [Fusobacteriaceae bacterium]
MKKLLLVICLVLSTVLIGCGKKAEEKKVYHVGTNAEYAPFEYLENGKIVGFDIELLETIAKKVGIEIQWDNMSFDGLIPALQSGKIDMAIAAMTVTEARMKTVNFSAPYQESPTTFLTTTESTFNDMKDIKGKKYGVQLGTTQEVIASGIENAEIVTYTSVAVAILDLKANKLDSVLVDKSVANNFIGANSGIKSIGDYQGESKAIAFNKNFDKELLEKINKVIEEMKKDGSLDALGKKYKI